jgi:glycerophosphoryl diester phosphodiesterase
VSLPKPAGGYLKVAHRGASALAPENSLAALEAALAAKVDMVELDVLALDGALRLAHSAAQVQPDSPTLADALRLFARHAPPRVWLDLDVKTPGHEEGIVQAVAAHGRLVERTLVTSFHPQVLREAKRLEAGIVTGLAYPNDRHGLSERRPFDAFVAPGLRILRAALPARIGRMLSDAGADAAMLHHSLVTAKVVARCRAAGARVFAWTIETPDDLSRVLAAGVDGAIANDPTLFDE